MAIDGSRAVLTVELGALTREPRPGASVTPRSPSAMTGVGVQDTTIAVQAHGKALELGLGTSSEV